MASRRNRLISRPPPIPSWGYSGTKWNYIPDAVGLEWNDPLPARCFGAWITPEPANEIVVDWVNLTDTGTGLDKGEEAIGGGDGQWKVTSRSAVYAGTIEVGDFYDRLGVLRDDALAVADTIIRLPAKRFRLNSASTSVTYQSSDPQAGRKLLLWGVADSDGLPLTHVNGLVGGSIFLDVDCDAGADITIECRNIRHGAWQEDIDVDAWTQFGGGFTLHGESNTVIFRNMHFRNCQDSGWDAVHKDTNECEHRLHTAFFASDCVIHYCGSTPLEHGQYDASSGPWIDIRVRSGPQIGHCLRWAADGMGLNCALIGRNDPTLPSGHGLQTLLNLMPAAPFHGENLAIYPHIGDVSGYNSRAGIQIVPRRDGGGYATSPRWLGVDRAKALSPYVKDETQIERWRYQDFIYGGDLLVDGSEHNNAALYEDASGTSVRIRYMAGLFDGNSGVGFRTVDPDTTTDAWEMVFIDWSDGRREVHDATLTAVLAGDGNATFTLATSLSALYPKASTIIAMRQKANHPSGEQRWDQMRLNEPYYNPRHPLSPWRDAVVDGVTPDGCWAELSWPSAHNKSLHNIYFRPLEIDSAISALIEVYGSIAETFRPDLGTNRHPYPPLNNGDWPPAPGSLVDGAWAPEGIVAVTGENASLYGTDGSGGNGVNGSLVRDHNVSMLSNFSAHVPSGTTTPLASQIRHTTIQAATEQQAACWWLDQNGDPQRVIVSPSGNVSPLPTSTETTISGAVTGSTSEPTKTVVLASATGASVGKGIHIEMAGAMGGWGVLFDEIAAIDGTTVTLRMGAPYDISDGARVAIFTKAGTPPKPWQTASKLWERFRDFSMT